jgi:hypothetical protein
VPNLQAKFVSASFTAVKFWFQSSSSISWRSYNSTYILSRRKSLARTTSYITWLKKRTDRTLKHTTHSPWKKLLMCMVSIWRYY